MSRPLVSIVICCHNRRDYLALTLRSVLEQRYQPVEIIVMDDGSTDGTDALVAGFGGCVRYFRQASRGIAVARTVASRLARGDLIAYQDDDDLMPPNRIESLHDALCRFPQASFATGDFALIDADGVLTGQRWLPGSLEETGPTTLLEDGHDAVLWPRVPAVPHTTLFRRELGEAVGWFDPEFRYACSDADFLARLGRLGPVAYVREVVSLYRRGHAALWADDLRTGCSRVQLWEKHLALLDDGAAPLRRRLHDRLLNVLVRLERLRQQGATDPRFDLDGYIGRGLALLPGGHRRRFLLQARVKLPLRRLMRRKRQPLPVSSP